MSTTPSPESTAADLAGIQATVEETTRKGAAHVLEQVEELAERAPMLRLVLDRAAPAMRELVRAESDLAGVWLETARDLVVDICHSLAVFGARRFYVLNTGFSTMRPLAQASEVLSGQGILLQYTDIETIAADATRSVQQQEGGTHADEIETSMMLHVRPETVGGERTDDYYLKRRPAWLRTSESLPSLTASGGVGNSSNASAHDGEVYLNAAVAGILAVLDRA